MCTCALVHVEGVVLHLSSTRLTEESPSYAVLIHMAALAS